MHTGPIPAIVTAEMTLELMIVGDYGVPVPADFHYGAHEPFSVTVRFHTAEETVQWVFARELLQKGTQSPVGDGDITCWPAVIDGRRVICMSLRSPTGQALLQAPADEVSAFLRRTHDVIPAGTEASHLDLDGLILDLLDGQDR